MIKGLVSKLIGSRMNTAVSVDGDTVLEEEVARTRKESVAFLKEKWDEMRSDFEDVILEIKNPARIALANRNLPPDVIKKIGECRVIILTANDIEAEITSRLFSGHGVLASSLPAWDIGNGYPLPVRITEYGGINILLVQQNKTGSDSKYGSEGAINDVLKFVEPSFVVSCGVAFGYSADYEKLGDVIISTGFITTNGAEEGDKFTFKEDICKVDDEIFQRWKKLKDLNKKAFPGESAVPFTWYFGTIIHTPNIYNSPYRKRDIINGLSKRNIEDAVGGEMESLGIHNACTPASITRPCIPWITIKGICDWGFLKNNWDVIFEEAGIVSTEEIDSDNLNSFVKDCIQAYATRNAFAVIKFLFEYDRSFFLSCRDARINTIENVRLDEEHTRLEQREANVKRTREKSLRNNKLEIKIADIRRQIEQERTSTLKRVAELDQEIESMIINNISAQAERKGRNHRLMREAQIIKSQQFYHDCKMFIEKFIVLHPLLLLFVPVCLCLVAHYLYLQSSHGNTYVSKFPFAVFACLGIIVSFVGTIYLGAYRELFFQPLLMYTKYAKFAISKLSFKDSLCVLQNASNYTLKNIQIKWIRHKKKKSEPIVQSSSFNELGPWHGLLISLSSVSAEEAQYFGDDSRDFNGHDYYHDLGNGYFERVSYSEIQRKVDFTPDTLQIEYDFDGNHLVHIMRRRTNLFFKESYNERIYKRCASGYYPLN